MKRIQLFRDEASMWHANLLVDGIWHHVGTFHDRQNALFALWDYRQRNPIH